MRSNVSLLSVKQAHPGPSPTNMPHAIYTIAIYKKGSQKRNNRVDLLLKTPIDAFGADPRPWEQICKSLSPSLTYSGSDFLPVPDSESPGAAISIAKDEAGVLRFTLTLALWKDQDQWVSYEGVSLPTVPSPDKEGLPVDLKDGYEMTATRVDGDCHCRRLLPDDGCYGLQAQKGQKYNQQQFRLPPEQPR